MINSLIINDISHKNLNFKNYLTTKDTIIWNNCKELKLKIKSKINKIEFDKCHNIKIYLLGTITSIEINKSSNIKIIIPDNHSISCIQTYNSNIYIKCDKILFKSIPIINENSNIEMF